MDFYTLCTTVYSRKRPILQSFQKQNLTPGEAACKFNLIIRGRRTVMQHYKLKRGGHIQRLRWEPLRSPLNNGSIEATSDLSTGLY